MTKRSLYRLIWIPSFIALVTLLYVFAHQPHAIALAAELVTYTTSDKTLSLQCPSNWKPYETSAQAVMTQVEFRPNDTTDFNITSDLSGSLMADIARASSELPTSLPGIESQALPAQKPAIDSLHEAQSKALAKRYDDFQDGTARKAQIAGFEARISKFSYTKGNIFGSRAMEGERVTILSGDRHITILCHCLKEMQKLYFPTFESMIYSLKVSQVGG